MLQKLRQFSKSWISSLFLGILSLAFVSWGVGDILQGHTDTAVIRVGKTAVDQTDFQRDYNNYLRNLGAQRGGAISPETAKREHIPDTLVQQTVLTTALDNVVKRLELTASDSLVMTRIRAMQQFAGINGAFDRNVFQQLIERYNYTEKSFIEQVRADFARAQLETAVEGGFTMPVGYARAIMAFASEQRAADYVVVNDSGLAPIAAPSDAVLTAYARTHVGSYSTPEYRDVTFAKLAPEDVAATLNVTDAQIKRAYDARHEQYVIAEKRSVERLTFPDQKAAAEAKAKIDAGQSFADAAKSRGFAEKDISLGDVVAADLDKAEATAVFAVKDGGVTAPVKSTFGWNIYHVTKIIPGKVTPIEQAHDELKALVQKELARAKLDDVSNAYTDAVTSGLSLTEAAKKAGLTTIHVASIDRDGLKADGTKADAPDDAEFRALIFKSEIGEEGDPVLTKAGTLYVIQVNGTVPPKLRPLDQVRDKVLAAWTAEERA
ncbi:MAG: SurA N-terminal domain-containing protein, partial [Rhizomicrobium sp.]